MNRKFLVALTVAIVLLSGCASIPGEDTDKTETSTTEFSTETTSPPPTPNQVGFIEARVVSTTPENFTAVSFNNTSLQESEIQDTIERAIQLERAETSMQESELEKLEDQMPDEAFYDGDNFGYYFGYKSEIVQVRIIWYVS